jgi:NAD(P)-dependent dehydrogenase (short-subunit alcohol dehydrogenase family)
MEFKNKTVVITGAARGIGAACADAFEAEGARLGLLDVAPASRKGDERLYVDCDVTSASQVSAALEVVATELGGIDILVNNAGIQRYGTVTETSVETWDEVMNVNVKGLFLAAKYAIPWMQKKGKGVVVNVASVQAFLSQKNVAAYTTAKSAILGLTRSIAVDYAPRIRSVAVCPGTIDTPMLRESFALSPDPDLVEQECVDMHLAGRIGTPEEVANLILFLAGDKASFITGQAFRIDGGLGITIGGSKREG